MIRRNRLHDPAQEFGNVFASACAFVGRRPPGRAPRLKLETPANVLAERRPRPVSFPTVHSAKASVMLPPVARETIRFFTLARPRHYSTNNREPVNGKSEFVAPKCGDEPGNVVNTVTPLVPYVLPIRLVFRSSVSENGHIKDPSGILIYVTLLCCIYTVLSCEKPLDA